MHSHQLGAVREGGFDLDFVNHFSHAVHHVGGGEQLSAFLHKFCHRFAAACHLGNLTRDVRNGLRVIQLYTAGTAFLCQISGQMQQ